MNIIGQLKNKKDFIGFLTLNCFDKAFIFLLPIILMFLTQSQELYNDLEYVFSLANVVVPFLVFISSYSFYGYKISHNKEVFVKHYNVICCASILLLTLLSAILLCTMKCTALYVWIYLFVAVRLCYQFYLSCYNNYYRLTDAPTVVLWISIASSVLSVVLMLVVGKIGLKEYSLYAFFLPQSFPIFYSIRSIRACFKTEFWKEWGEYIRNAILFAWPAVLNCTIVAFVMNYGKIYAYNELTSDEMYNFSYIMRISLVVQMMHSSVMAYYSKHIYLNGFKKSFLVKYVGLLFFALAIAFTFLMAFNVFAEKPIPVNLVVVLLFAYTLFYCTGSLLEMHFGRINKNHLILIASAISAIVYLSIVFTVKIKSLLPLAVAMLVNSILFLMLMCLFAMLNKKEFWNKGGYNNLIFRILSCLISVLPFNYLRIFLYRNILKYDIDYGSKIAPFNLICCKSLKMRGSRIDRFNIIIVENLKMGNNSYIRSMNKVSLLKSLIMKDRSMLDRHNKIWGLYRDSFDYKERCVIEIGEDSLVKAASVDVTDNVRIGRNVVFGGMDTHLWTHGFDHLRNMIIKPVTIGNNVYIGSRCTICSGVTICDDVSIGAATCVSKSISEPGFYVSNQMIRK